MPTNNLELDLIFLYQSSILKCKETNAFQK
jgi:hypothetical protein